MAETEFKLTNELDSYVCCQIKLNQHTFVNSALSDNCFIGPAVSYCCCSWVVVCDWLIDQNFPPVTTAV